MASSVTVTNLIDGGKRLSDRVGDASVPDATWAEWCRDAIEETYGVVTNAYQDTYSSSVDFTLVSGVYQYTLPAIGSVSPREFRRLKGLTLDPDKSTRLAVRRMAFAERDDVGGLWLGAWIGVPPNQVPWCPRRRYRVEGRVIIIQPLETAAGNYRAYYAAAPIKPADQSDAAWRLDDELDRWAEYIKLVMARKALNVEESPTRWIDERLAQMRDDMTNDANQDEAPDSTSDVGW